MPTAYRRCFYIDSSGLQCEEWFPADNDDKLCASHREIVSPSGRNGHSEESKVRYIDLVNDERKYCYHFLDGEAQQQKQELIFQFLDDAEGTVFEKLDRHIAFLEKVLEDVRARQGQARHIRQDKLNELSEDQRKELRKIKIEKALSSPTKVSVKKDPIAHLVKKGLSESDAKAFLDMDPDELIAKFKAARENKGENS